MISWKLVCKSGFPVGTWKHMTTHDNKKHDNKKWQWKLNKRIHPASYQQDHVTNLQSSQTGSLNRMIRSLCSDDLHSYQILIQ